MSDQTNPLREALRYDFRKDGTVTNTQAEVLADRTMKIIASHTPSSWWSVQDKPDPHGTIYDCERAALAHGDMTDDELANAVFLYDHRGGFGSIGLLTAAKDRIRWLSRRLPVVDDAAISRACHAVLEQLKHDPDYMGDINETFETMPEDEGKQKMRDAARVMLEAGLRG